MKSAFLTFAYGSEEFHELSLVLLNSVDTKLFDLFVYTDRPDFYKLDNIQVINYQSHPCLILRSQRSEHHGKIVR